MEMKDLNELLQNQKDALENLMWRCKGIVNYLSEYRRDILIGIWGEKFVRELDALELAYESATKDLNECLAVEAESASFKDN